MRCCSVEMILYLRCAAFSFYQIHQNDMLFRQEMEAESLAARQTSELDNERAPVLLVSFPFTQVFEQARQELIAILQ